MTIRRLKTYSGSLGYVYQYYFVGKRVKPAAAGLALGGDEYIFDVTSDRKMTYAVSIFLPQSSVAQWQQSHGRTLSDSEKYAAAKMRLFRAFDESEGIQSHGREMQIDVDFLEASLSGLGVD